MHFSYILDSTIRNTEKRNRPRCGHSLNDGFSGGNVIEGNLLFDSVRETADHGMSKRITGRVDLTFRVENVDARSDQLTDLLLCRSYKYMESHAVLDTQQRG